MVPGSSFADIFMRLAIVELISAAQLRWPLVSFAVVVDDIQGLAYGEEEYVVKAAAEACRFLCDGLEARGLPLSEPKLQLVGNRPSVVKAVGRRCRRLRRAALPTVRNLGVDFTGGRRTRHKVRARRVSKVLARARRLRRLGRFGASAMRIARAALGPAALFAASASGVLPSHIRSIRKAIHVATVKNPCRRSATVDVALLDPEAEQPPGPRLLPGSARSLRRRRRPSSWFGNAWRRR